MRHFDDEEGYREFVKEVAGAERDLTEDVPKEDRPDHLDGYEGYEDEYTIAKRVIGVPAKVGDEVTMRFNGEPWVKTRACPVSVFLCSDNTDILPDDIIDERDLYQAAIMLFARDIKEELS